MINTAVILAGGKSTRYGQHKGLVPIDGKPLIAYLIQIIRESGIEKIYLSTDDSALYSEFGLECISDKIKNAGPLSGIHSAFENLDADSILFLSCDLPRITSTEITKLINESQTTDDPWVFASTPRKDHPLCAVIRKMLLPALTKTLADGKHGVLDFCSEIPTHLVYFKDENRFLNLNSPEDLRKADHITFDPDQTVEHDVLRYHREDGFSRVDDPVVRESLVRIWLNDDEVAVIHALNSELEELAVGFLFTECIINDVSKIQSIECNDRLHSVTINTNEPTHSCKRSIVRTVSPGCGQVLFAIRPSFAEQFDEVESDIKVKPEKILELMKQLLKSSGLFEETGGVHTSALADCEIIIHITDDIGRHNCIDKLIGRELRNPTVEQSRRMVLTSGRISSEIVTKAIRGHIPFLVSHSAPSEGAIQLAGKYGITLIGFTRGARFNVYSHEERIEQ